MKLIIFILIVLIIAALLIRIILRSVNQHSPLLMQLHAAGIRTGDAERILSGGEYWQRQKTLLTEREVSFMKGLFRIVGKRLVRTVLIFTEISDQLSRATDRVPGLPASPGYVQ